MDNVNKKMSVMEIQKALTYKVRKLIFGLHIDSPMEDLEKVRDEIKELMERLKSAGEGTPAKE